MIYLLNDDNNEQSKEVQAEFNLYKKFETTLDVKMFMNRFCKINQFTFDLKQLA